MSHPIPPTPKKSREGDMGDTVVAAVLLLCFLNEGMPMIVGRDWPNSVKKQTANQ